MEGPCLCLPLKSSITLFTVYLCFLYVYCVLISSAFIYIYNIYININIFKARLNTQYKIFENFRLHTSNDRRRLAAHQRTVSYTIFKAKSYWPMIVAWCIQYIVHKPWLIYLFIDIIDSSAPYWNRQTLKGVCLFKINAVSLGRAYQFVMLYFWYAEWNFCRQHLMPRGLIMTFIVR